MEACLFVCLGVGLSGGQFCFKKRAGEEVCYFVGGWLNEKVIEKRCLSLFW
jgi:hypothetical protein